VPTTLKNLKQNIQRGHRVGFAQLAKNEIKQDFIDRNVLVTYLYDKETDRPHGVVVATRDENGRVVVGSAACNLQKDKFDRYVGTYIAKHRALTGSPAPSTNLPIEDAILRMRARATKYWKTEPTGDYMMVSNKDGNKLYMFS